MIRTRFQVNRVLDDPAARCRFSDSPASRAPLMGEHTEDVLRSLAGYAREEIQQLREKQVI